MPFLAVETGIEPATLAVGEVFTVTYRIANQAQDPANDVVVTLPLPSGVVPQQQGGTMTPVASPSPSSTGTTPSGTAPATQSVAHSATVASTSVATLSAKQGYANAAGGADTSVMPGIAATGGQTGRPFTSGNNLIWQVGNIAPEGITVLTTTMLLSMAQPGNALVLTPQLTASNASRSGSNSSSNSSNTKVNTTTSMSNAVGGAIVVQRDLPTATATFVPGSQVVLHSADSGVTLTVPGNAYTATLILRHGIQPPVGGNPVLGEAGRAKGLPTFYLGASDGSGNPVHQFSSPLTVTVTYTPEQLQALGISEQDLTLFWFNRNADKWVGLDTNVDPSTHKVVAQVSQLGVGLPQNSPSANNSQQNGGIKGGSDTNTNAFKLSDGSSPSAQYMPSLQGWQVGMYTGNAGYEYPIDVPSGPGGII